MPTNFFLDRDGNDLEIVEATLAAAEVLRERGAVLVDVTIPGAEHSHELMRTLIWAEAYAVHRERLATQPERIGDDIRRRLLLGEGVTGAAYAAARNAARAFARSTRAAFASCDVIVAPTTGTTAPLVADSETIATTDRLTRATYAWSLAGLPTVAVPAGLAANGMPIGIQLACAPGEDARALAVAEAFQSVTMWHRLRPPTLPPISRGTRRWNGVDSSR